MTSPTTIRDSIQALLHTTAFAVLATESAGQPHTSLIAITPFDDGRRLVFATYRNTRKFTNLMQNQRVSVLVDGRCRNSANGALTGFILSAVGRAQEVDTNACHDLLDGHLQRHPDLVAFTQTPDCVLLEVVVASYQVVRGIDDVTWWRVDDPKDVPLIVDTEEVGAVRAASWETGLQI
jgi:heme iron utilization protein